MMWTFPLCYCALLVAAIVSWYYSNNCHFVNPDNDKSFIIITQKFFDGDLIIIIVSNVSLWYSSPNNISDAKNSCCPCSEWDLRGIFLNCKLKRDVVETIFIPLRKRVTCPSPKKGVSFAHNNSFLLPFFAGFVCSCHQIIRYIRALCGSVDNNNYLR